MWLPFSRKAFLRCSGSWCSAPRRGVYSAPTRGWWTRLMWTDFPAVSIPDKSSSSLPFVLSQLAGTIIPLCCLSCTCPHQWHLFPLLTPYLYLRHLLLLTFGFGVLWWCGRACHIINISLSPIFLLYHFCMSYNSLCYLQRWKRHLLWIIYQSWWRLSGRLVVYD